MTTTYVLCSGQFYLLHVEIINLLLVLASTQLYSTSASAPVGTHPFIDALMQQQHLAALVVQRALGHFSSRPSLPSKLQLWSPSPDAQDIGVLKLVRSAAGQLMTCAHVPLTGACVSQRNSSPACHQSLGLCTAIEYSLQVFQRSYAESDLTYKKLHALDEALLDVT